VHPVGPKTIRSPVDNSLLLLVWLERVLKESQLERESISWPHGKSALMLSFMKDHRQRTNRSRSYAKITSVRTSFHFYANGPRALGKTRKHADISKSR
jgi:hypothetical protein